ncbi:MAG: HipA domain-containing protein, partial [Alcanivorax sp.]|uniref:HipA domain-containing protein n=1 Tax=Alcanivorax sp. TaxID=1872427 RepID=UPI003DA73266
HHEPANIEQMGTKSKFWYEDEKGTNWLFKSNETINSSGELIIRPGENWAEKCAYEICLLLKIPAPEIHLATHHGRSGIISKNFIRENETLVFANEFITKYSKGKGGKIEERKNYHTAGRIHAALETMNVLKPAGWNSLPNIKTAADFFCGYLVLDCLISNQDRHEENWGIVSTEEETLHLSPSFDHAASMGRNESDENRISRLNTKDKGQMVSTYVNKAKSQLYDKSGKRLKTIEALGDFSRRSPKALSAWSKALQDIEFDKLKEIFDKVPSEIMSDPEKSFSLSIIVENSNRIAALAKDLK